MNAKILSLSSQNFLESCEGCFAGSNNFSTGKVKFALQQGSKAQRGSTVIALLIRDLGAGR
jgi:hypothetical protein